VRVRAPALPLDAGALTRSRHKCRRATSLEGEVNPVLPLDPLMMTHATAAVPRFHMSAAATSGMRCFDVSSTACTTPAAGVRWTLECLHVLRMLTLEGLHLLRVLTL
jgi:hypothetical protein